MSVHPFHNVAIVTGGSGDLGQVIVRRLHSAGFHVLVTDIDVHAAERVASTLGERGKAAQLDVVRSDDFTRAIQLAKSTWGGLGVLVNTAALTRTTPLFEITADEFDAVTAIALKGTFLGCQAAGRVMQEQRYGRIINIASLAGQNGGAATGAHYAAAKGGILTLTKVFARELAAANVTVNAISPGPLDLDSVRGLLTPEKLAGVVSTIPVGHLGDPEFIAEMTLLLASPKATSLTGATVDINGGLYLR